MSSYTFVAINAQPVQGDTTGTTPTSVAVRDASSNLEANQVKGFTGLTSAGNLINSGISAKAATFSVDGTKHFYPCDATAGAITVNLPAVSSNTGLRVCVKKTDASTNVVTLDGNASETIDGATTKALSTQYKAYEILCDGATWHIVAAAP